MNLSQTSDRLLEGYKRKQSLYAGNPTLPTIKIVQELNKSARMKIREIVQKGASGVDESEIVAAKELLNSHANMSIGD